MIGVPNTKLTLITYITAAVEVPVIGNMITVDVSTVEDVGSDLSWTTGDLVFVANKKYTSNINFIASEGYNLRGLKTVTVNDVPATIVFNNGTNAKSRFTLTLKSGTLHLNYPCNLPVVG